MQYKSAINIYNAPESVLAALQPGQWVYAGGKDSMGRFCRIKRNGIVVVAWGKDQGRFATLNKYSKA